MVTLLVIGAETDARLLLSKTLKEENASVLTRNGVAITRLPPMPKKKTNKKMQAMQRFQMLKPWQNLNWIGKMYPNALGKHRNILWKNMSDEPSTATYFPLRQSHLTERFRIVHHNS